MLPDTGWIPWRCRHPGPGPPGVTIDAGGLQRAFKRAGRFELTDALLCADGPTRTPVELSLLAEHQRGYGSLYGALNHGRLDTDTLRDLLISLPLPPRFGGRIVLTVDVSPWPRSDAACSPERLFCLVHGRNGRSSGHVVPGWPYSFVAALTPDRTSWTQVPDAVRLGPADDAVAVTADQLRAVVGSRRY